MISDREIREKEEWKAVAAALKDESDIPPAAQDFTSRCLHAALRGQRPAGLRQLRERRRWLRIAAAAAALCALTAAGAAAILGSRGAALRVAADSDNTDVSPVALEAKPESRNPTAKSESRNPNPAQAFDDPMPRRSDDLTIRRFDDSTIRRFDDLTIRRFDDLTQGDTMNTTTLRTLAASAAIAAAGAPLATSASSAESGRSVMTAASNSFTLDTRPSPQTLAATIESFSTQPTAFVLSVR